MDAVQFGRWLQSCRRKRGFPSQRALVERIQQESVLAPAGISEAFLARLEAGLLAHPFRGTVRKRVLVLARLLCKTPRELTSYLRAAELAELDAEERAQIEQLHQDLSRCQQQRIVLLPPHPPRFFGRQSRVEEALEKLRTLKSGLYLITGMPGVGKSALAAEILHQLAHNQARATTGAFPDGIAAFRCRGYRGQAGLLSLLEDIIASFGLPSRPGGEKSALPLAALNGDAVATRAMARVRLALSNRSVLFLLDDVEATFPLREALDVILSQGHSSRWEGTRRSPQRVVLATSCYKFTPSIVCQHLHLEPLAPEDAFAYFTDLLPSTVHAEEVECARELCAAVGNLPLAIEGLASLAANGVPPGLLSATLGGPPHVSLLEHAPELHNRLERAIAPLDTGARRTFALLAALGVTSFGLESAAALCASPAYPDNPRIVNQPRPAVSAMDTVDERSAHLAERALELGQLVRHSLVELAPESSGMANTPEYTSLPALHDTPRRYLLHPILRTYALKRLNRLEPASIEAAHGNSLAYALHYLEQHREHNSWLLSERDFLFTSFKYALQTEQYAKAVRFVDALAPISCRMRQREDGIHLFLWGIQACQKLHDRPLEMRFMTSLGVLYCLQGAFADARQVWEETLAMNTSLSRPQQNWQPLLRLAHLSHLQGEEEAAIHAVETYLWRSQESASPLQHALAYARLALYKRLRGERENAHTQVRSGLELLSTFPEEHARIATTEDYVALQVQIELARIQGDYSASRRYMETVAAFLREEEEPYLLAEVLSEQANFALQQAMWHDTRNLASDMLRAAEEVKASYFQQRSLYLLHMAREG